MHSPPYNPRGCTPWHPRWPWEVKDWLFGKMDDCNEFRKPETYKNNPLEQIFKISNLEENLLIWQPEFKKSTLTTYFCRILDDKMICCDSRWNWVDEEKIKLKKKIWSQKKFFLNTPKLKKKDFLVTTFSVVIVDGIRLQKTTKNKNTIFWQFSSKNWGWSP